LAHLEKIEESFVKVPLRADSKGDVIRELVEFLKASGKIVESEAVTKEVEAREALCSTGLQMGIAIPHAKTTYVSGLVIAVGISSGGVDFGALDGKPSKIFFMILTPPEQAMKHLEVLSEISNIAQSKEKVNQLCEAATAAEVVDLLSE
jgi:nitrogen PTS system EIIA component